MNTIQLNEEFILKEEEASDAGEAVETSEAYACLRLPAQYGRQLSAIVRLLPGAIVDSPQELGEMLNAVNFACQEIPECLFRSIRIHGKAVKKLLGASWVKELMDYHMPSRADLLKGLKFYFTCHRKRWPYGAWTKCSKATLEKALNDYPAAEYAVRRSRSLVLDRQRRRREWAFHEYRGWKVGDVFASRSRYFVGGDARRYRIHEVLVDGYRCFRLKNGTNQVCRTMINIKFTTMMTRRMQKCE